MTRHLDSDLSEWLADLSACMSGFARDELFVLTQTPEKEWWAQLLDDAASTALVIEDLLAKTKRAEGGCLEASQGRSKRVTLKQKQVYAYQLIYWAGNALIPSSDDVVRHKCHNRRCINPLHLTHGTQRDNLNDTRDR
ncbi:hypothetical protein NeNHUV3_15110 [Nereida sp. NH-UV-3]